MDSARPPVDLVGPRGQSKADRARRRRVVSRFWSKTICGLSPYVPGEQPRVDDLVKLNTNENPYDPSPRVVEAIAQEAAQRLRLYPEPESDSVRRAVCRHHGVSPEQVFVGNGSDEVLAHVFRALLQHEAPILFPDVTYTFYPVFARLYGIAYETVALDAHFNVRVDDYVRPNGGIVLANPNAPTGLALPIAQIERLLQRNRDSVVVVDEAYVDFGAESAVPLVGRYDNLLVVHTLSKARSLAGLRVGFAMGHPELVEGLERVKNSFNSYPLDRLAIVGAVAALEDQDHFERTRQSIMITRTVVTEGLRELGFEVLPSCANFVFARHPQHDARALLRGLREARILVRHFSAPRIEQFLRISIGTDYDAVALLGALRLLVPK
ncbi:MAG: histidinol-phosphate transaminase [Polyangiaceae bacterium]|nr:histidinol-phosphate transaminase [Polyangiaceae bacterium]